MKLKETVSMDVLKEFNFQMAENNSESGFQRYRKHYGVLLVTGCNCQLNKAIKITLNANSNEAIGGKRLVASIHQLNHDLCEMAERGYLDMQEASVKPQINDWDSQIKANNPFSFMMD